MKADHLEVERRIDEITELLINRIGYRTIVSYALTKWGIGERQAAIYISRARRRILEAAAESREEQHSKALASYDALYARQLAAGRLSEARRTLDSIVRLLGLAAPEKLELYDFSSYSDKQLAEEVARELPELFAEAERLTGGVTQADASKEERQHEVDPPHPDS